MPEGPGGMNGGNFFNLMRSLFGLNKTFENETSDQKPLLKKEKNKKWWHRFVLCGRKNMKSDKKINISLFSSQR